MEPKTCKTFGYFGWKMLSNGMVIPYIYRGEDKYCATKIAQFSIFLMYQRIRLHDDLMDFSFINEYAMTIDEICMMNEINHLHNDSKYKLTFVSGDTILPLYDVIDIMNYLNDCHQTILNGQEWRSEKFGTIRIYKSNDSNEMDVVPFVLNNGQRYVPIVCIQDWTKAELFDKQTHRLTGIHLLYMKFVYRCLQMETNSINSYVLCAPMQAFEKCTRSVLMFIDNFPVSQTHEHLIQTDSIAGAENDHTIAVINATASITATTSDEQPTLDAVNESIELSQQPQRIPDAEHQSKANKKPKSNANRQCKQNVSKRTKTKKQSTNDFYEVEKILDLRSDRNGKEFGLFRWKNYSSAYDSWEPLSNCNKLMQKDIRMLKQKLNKIRGKDAKKALFPFLITNRG